MTHCVKYISSRIQFINVKTFNITVNWNKEDLLEVTMLSETNLIELLNFVNNEGVNITSIKIKLVDENNLTLSVDFDN